MVRAGAVSSVHQTFIEHFLSTSYCLRQQRIMTNMEQSFIPRCFFLLEEKFYTIEFSVLMWYKDRGAGAMKAQKRSTCPAWGSEEASWRSYVGGLIGWVAAGFGKEDVKSSPFRGKDAMMLYGVRGPESPSAVLEQSSEGDWGAEGGETGMVMRALDVMLRSLDSSLSRAMRRAKKVSALVRSGFQINHCGMVV